MPGSRENQRLTPSSGFYDQALHETWALFLKRKWVFVSVIAFLLACARTYLLFTPAVYEASVLLRMDERLAITGLLPEAAGRKADPGLEASLQTVTSLKLAQNVAKSLEKDAGLKGESAKENERLNALASRYLPMVSAKALPGSLISITVQSRDAKEAARMANAFAEEFGKMDHELKSSDARAAREFVGTELDGAKKRLEVAEKKLQSFLEKLGPFKPEAETTYSPEKLAVFENALMEIKEKKAQLEWTLERERSNDPNSEFAKSVSLSSPELIEMENREKELEAQTAAELAVYSEKHPRIQDLRSRLNRVRSEYRDRFERLKDLYLGSLERQIQLLEGQEAALAVRVEERVTRQPENELEKARMEREIDIAEKQYSLLSDKYNEARIAEAAIVPEATVISRAQTPSNPSYPKSNVIYLLVFCLGVFLAILLVTSLEQMDTSIWSSEEAEASFGLPVLGVIPHIPAAGGWKIPGAYGRSINASGNQIQEEPFGSAALKHHKGRIYLAALLAPSAPSTEAHRLLRANLQYRAEQDQLKTILIASAAAREGKTMTSVNLALLFAQSGLKTLLISTDMRNPDLHRAFGLPAEPGLADVLLERTEWKDAVRSSVDFVMGELGEIDAIRNLDRLHIIPPGKTPEKPNELLASGNIRDLLGEVREAYDLVLIDSPPVLPVPDAVTLAPLVDGALLVIQAGRLPRKAILQAIRQLQDIGAHLVGLTINDLKPKHAAESSSYKHAYKNPYAGKTS